MMKRLFVGLLLALSVAACSRQRAEVVITAPSMADGTEVVVARLAVNQWVPMDTLTVNGGKVTYALEGMTPTPDFYCLLQDQQRLASFVAKVNDRLEIRVDEQGQVQVTGSDEAELFQQAEVDFEQAQRQFNELSLAMAAAQAEGDVKKQQQLQLELGRFYVKYKQQSIRFLLSNPYSLVQVPILYRAFSNELPVFNEYRDALYFGRVYDSLRVTYPQSAYLHALKDEEQTRTQVMRLNEKLGQATESGFPDLSMPDQEGRIRTLSDEKGKVILLSFWTVTDPVQKLFNNELKAIYDKYHKRGLEIYQVALDVDKAQWAQAVKDQQLPWISVCDGMGVVSIAAAYYNVGSVPSLYLIDKEGNVRPEKNEFDPEALDKLIGKLLR